MSSLAEIATITASSLSAFGKLDGLSTLAKFTGTPFWSIGVITIKMISSTNMMSAIGMTLGAAITAPAWGLYAMTLLLSAGTAARDKVVDQLHRGVIHFHVERLDPVGEVV